MRCAFKKSRIGYQLPELRKARPGEYLSDLLKAYSMENVQRTHQIGYMDESYVHVKNMGNDPLANDDGDVSRRHPGKGQRVMTVHAKTNDGPLTATNFDATFGFPNARDDSTSQVHRWGSRARTQA